MILRGINFGSVHQASGVTNFDGRGYWFHPWLRFLGLDFRNTTFVAKTTTLMARAGNMPLKRDGITPTEWKPRCVEVNRKARAALNAVSLSGPGLEALIEKKIWQRQLYPFFISIMSLQSTREGRLAELEAIMSRLAAAKKYESFLAPWGVQINLSCPNGGVDPADLVDEAVPVLERAEKYLPDTVPVMLKFGPEAAPASMSSIVRHPRCDALCVFNTLPFGKHPTWAKQAPRVDWKGLWGTDDPEQSPIARRFPGFAGGLSGAPLLPFLLEWVRRVRSLGITTPICAGGGILSPYDAGYAFDAGADAIFLGSIAFLAPQRVRATVREAHRYAARLARKVPMPAHIEYNV